MPKHVHHSDFIQALHGRRRLRVVFVGKSDGERRDRTCAPLDYGPSRRAKNQEPKYHLFDYDGSSSRHTLSLAADQIISMMELEETFDPADIITWDVKMSPWFVVRDWAQFS